MGVGVVEVGIVKVVVFGKIREVLCGGFGVERGWKGGGG